MIFVFEVCNHFFNVVNRYIEGVHIIKFLSNQCSESLFSNGADGYSFVFLFHLYSINHTNFPKCNPLPVW